VEKLHNPEGQIYRIRPIARHNARLTDLEASPDEEIQRQGPPPLPVPPPYRLFVLTLRPAA